jgi:phosphoribosylformylglycinamidine synthase subunit PurSL
MRIEVSYCGPEKEGRVKRLEEELLTQLPGCKKIDLVDVYFVHNVPKLAQSAAEEVFADTVVQRVDCITGEAFPGERKGIDTIPPFVLEVIYKPGVTDTVALTARKAVATALDGKVAENAVFKTALQYRFWGDITNEELSRFALNLHNPLIQIAHIGEMKKDPALPLRYPHTLQPSPSRVEEWDLIHLTDDELKNLSKERLLALSLKELKAIQEYYSRKEIREERKKMGLGEAATDVELEMIAQTWSEHCKHKIFQAEILYREDEEEEVINSLFSTYIKKTTEDLWEKKGYLRSVFHDNSGVIQFDEETLLCFKAETHNSPSALDPYGGAITGIVGVNRDILGTGMGAKPIFNTNVLCFGYTNTEEKEIPRGLLHPREVLRGVHRGIVDGGNQSGIPVIAGAFLFDEDYLGKPLVYCGTGGMLPSNVAKRKGWEKDIKPGYKAVMLGGRIGKDGIHGATFSSEALNETSPTSAVQIGDPIVQKMMTDFLLEARDRGLYQGITDNGAGGLSSSLGEMAELAGGVKIELDACPLKYQGLAPWEVLLSESQERMSLAVSKETLEEFLKLARKRDVEATVIGEFTDTQAVEILYGGKRIGYIDLSFLHHGLPKMRLKAEWTTPQWKEKVPEELSPSPAVLETTVKDLLLRLLREPNISSKEPLIRQYDHEVQGRTLEKPFTGIKKDAPTDGGVIKPKYNSLRGITVTHGICPWYSPLDTYHMAACAVDEAYRAHIALGGRPELTGGLDNFCWPDPVLSEETPDGPRKLAQLVRACKGLRDACMAYGIPLISGKDSMKNDARLGNRKISVKPTLLISLMGIIEDVRGLVSTDFKQAGHRIYCIGITKGELGGTFLERVARLASGDLGGPPRVDFGEAVKDYEATAEAIRRGLLSSCHDVSDGGLGAALAESALGGRLGVSIDLSGVVDQLKQNEGRYYEEKSELDVHIRALFCESPSRFLVSLPKEREEEFLHCFSERTPVFLGEVIDAECITIERENRSILKCSLDEIVQAWKGSFL